MSPLLIYTPQNGAFLKELLDGMALLLASTTFTTARDIVMTLSVGMVGHQYVKGKKLESLSRFVITTFVVAYVLLGIKVPVAIIDMQTVEGAGEALTVDHVPLGVALPSAIISGMGYGLTSAFSDAFHMPDGMEYNKTGMIFGARTWLAATQARLTMSPDLSLDLSTYIRQCVFAAKLLASHQLSPEALVNSEDLIKTYFDNPSPIYRVILHDGTNLGCAEAAVNLKNRITPAVGRELERLNHLVTTGGVLRIPKAGEKSDIQPVKFKDSLAAAHAYFMNIAKDSAAIVTQNILINAVRDAAADAFAFSGADAALMNYTNTNSTQKMHIAEANSFWLAGFRLPYYMTVMWMLTLCIFPLVVLISFLPTRTNAYFLYLQSQVYLWSWPPMFIIIHWFVSMASSTTISLFGEKSGGVTFSNVDALATMHSNFAYTAGALATSVPVLAYYITKGLGSILSNAAQHFGGIAQSLSVSEAQSAAQGQISMASYSGWNMNYDNTNAHKFDTNYQHAEGRSTVQMNNGALLSQNADGSHVGNTQPAISNAAVTVHGSDRIVDSLHQSANESFSRAHQLRVAADDHLQVGLSKLKSFTENDANDFRSGTGVSNTVTDSINQDLRIMKDAVHHYNKHHDVASHTSVEAAAAYRLNSDKSLWGKGLQWVSGTSFDVTGTARTQASTAHSFQWLNNSSEGQAFNKAFNHMIVTAETHHLDASDTHNLSGSEQIAANFASGKSLLEQGSAEFAHGEQLQKAASHAQENAKAIDSNLSQPFHNWVISKFGAEGEHVMLQTDSQSIAQQNHWANEFLRSQVGVSAIEREVHSALSETKVDLHKDYTMDAAQIKAKHHLHLQYQKDTESVLLKSKEEKMRPMSTEHLQRAQTLQARHRLSSVADDATNTASSVKHALDTTDKSMQTKYKHLNKEQ